ncbi:MAG: hypothetical protein ACRDS9_25550, partial [Pseudonocardiaceae bacterium]
ASAGPREGGTCIVDKISGECVIQIEDPGSGGGGGTGGGDHDQPADTGDGQSCVWQGKKPMPCTSEHGYWSNAENCYVKLMEPQPSPDLPIWGGEEGEGAVYWCYDPNHGTILHSIWRAEPPAGAAAGPSPGEIARQVVARMNLKAIQIGIVPKSGADKMGLIGMPTWMWIENPRPNTAGPIEMSQTTAGLTVNVTARLDEIEWTMGDGGYVSCAGDRAKGTPYDPSWGTQDSPTCGYRYEKTSAGQPDNAFTVTAASHWVVNWEGGGQTGTIVLNPFSSSTTIRVGEMQVLEQ